MRLFERLLPSLDALALNYEVVCVDDGSSDATLCLLRDINREHPQVKVVALARNFGKDTALSAGIAAARGQAVLSIDADLQHPLEMIPEFLARWREGYEVVYAYRSSRHDESLPKRLLSRAYYGLVSRISDPVVPPHSSDFRLLDRKVVQVLNAMPERARFVKGLSIWPGFRQIGVAYQPHARHGGTTSWNLWKLWNFALDGLTAFSTLPLRIWTYVGMFVSLAAFLVGSYELGRVLLFGIDLPGYASIITSVLFLGGLQLIATGILGEYLARIFTEVKGRPLFVVRERIGFEEAGAAEPPVRQPA
jgi:glycosyltransferase involved in cell wall biosynthesis